MTPADVAARNRTRILLAFAAVYFVWGSTYLFIKYAVESIPPFMVGAVRYATAGAALYAIARWRGGAPLTRKEWGLAAIAGSLMAGMGNGSVIWTERVLPSGIAAVIVATVPLWIVVLDWMAPRGRRPRWPVLFGVLLGLAGIATLVSARSPIPTEHIDLAAAFTLLGGSVCWALGSVITRRAERPASALVFAAAQMLVASAGYAVVMLAAGELRGFSIGTVTTRSYLGMAYLIAAGSLIGFTAYIYLLGKVSAAKAATYAYVNPVIAVLLGWAFAGEPLTPRTMVAAAIILAGVAIITSTQGSPAARTDEHPLPTPTPKPERSAAA